MFIVGEENTEMDIKNESGNSWCGQSSFSPYVPTSSMPPRPRQDKGECRGCPPCVEPFPRRQGEQGTRDV